MICKNCGEDMLGDGFTRILHCPNSEDPELEYDAPDGNPYHCTPLKEEEECQTP